MLVRTSLTVAHQSTEEAHMRCGVAGVSLTAVAAIVASATPAAAQTPAGDSVAGGGSIDTDNAFTWSFDVRSGPSGENATGEMSIRVRPDGPSIESSDGVRHHVRRPPRLLWSHSVLGTLVTGDIVVTDARPFPTAKNECRNGGWKTYGDTFESQGQCVAVVQRGPKP